MELGPDGTNVNSERPVPRAQVDNDPEEADDKKDKSSKKGEGETKDKDGKEKDGKVAEDVLANENPRLYVMNLSY